MSDPLHDLQAAARKYAKHVLPGSLPRRVIIMDDSVRIIDVRMAPCCEGEMVGGGGPVPTTVPVAIPGWDFSAPVPRFDGTVVPIHGRKLDLLRILALAPHALKIGDLKAAWHDLPDVSEGSIRWFLGDLRRTMTSLFPGCEDPVHNDELGYSLTIR